MGNAVGFTAAMASNFGFCLKNVLWQEQAALSTAASTLRGTELGYLLLKATFSGVLFHVYQIVSVLILGRASSVTHSVVNTLKRPMLILVSALFFRTEVAPKNAFGIVCALSGAYIYGAVKA